MAVRQQNRKASSDVEAAPGQGNGAGLLQKSNRDLLIHTLRPLRRHSGRWEQMIVEQCDGQSIRQVVKTLYHYELRNGASLVDIGIWKTLFDRTVVQTVYELAHDGYISLVPDAKTMKALRAGKGNV